MGLGNGGLAHSCTSFPCSTSYTTASAHFASTPNPTSPRMGTSIASSTSTSGKMSSGHFASAPNPTSTSGTTTSSTSTPNPTSTSGSTFSPLSLVRPEILSIAERMRTVLLSEVPHLHATATHFSHPDALGKMIRPSVVLLIASSLATSGAPPPHLLLPDLRPATTYPPETRRRQQRIAEITEMIHVASLMHDDVLDDASTRRGQESANAAFGNKLAILGGDFLLARASVTLASLRDTHVLSLLATVIEHLVAGEVMQMEAEGDQLTAHDYYMKKTFYKTASLMAHGCQAVARIGEASPEVQSLAYGYGKSLGLAFQVIDDVLDYTSSAATLGKPALNDVKSGLATAPLLFAMETHPELRAMAQRRFCRPDDAERAANLVRDSDGVPRARHLASELADEAVACVDAFPSTSCPHALESREALRRISRLVLRREK